MENLVVRSPSFADSGLIPLENTGYGADLSPELQLTNLCEGAISLAVIMNDMGHPVPAYNHWVIWNIPAGSIIPGGIPCGETVESLGNAVQGCGYGRNRYKGPKPPFHWSHVYQFHVFVLDCFLDLPASSRKKQVMKAIQGHILQDAVLSGHYR